MNDKTVAGGGISLGSLCFIATLIFIILKALGTISWSWWLVFLPLIAYFGFCFAILFAILFVIAVIMFIAVVAKD